MFPWKKTKQQGWETRQHGWTEGTYEDTHVPSRVLTVPNRSAIIDYHVSINYLILRYQPVVISLSLSDSHLDAHFQVSSHRLSLTHTHRHLDAYFQVSKHRLSLSQNCHLDAYFQVSNHPLSLSLSHNCHPDAHFQLSNHCLSFPEVVTSMLISRCRTIISLSLSQRSWPRFPSRTHEQTKRRQRECTLRRSSALKLLGAHLCYTPNS
jgi:hypothetical protein